MRLAPAISLNQQLELGQDAYSEVLGDATVVTTGADAEMVNRVGQRIARCALVLSGYRPTVRPAG